jgi:hypothetical protein
MITVAAGLRCPSVTATTLIFGGRDSTAPARGRQGVPTHSAVPSANCWRFQMGTDAFSSSMS